jgi:hypothetical protein
MPAVLADLWPDDVAVSDVLSPAAIMRHQAGQLRLRTKGLLEADVISTTRKRSDDEETLHEFRITVPALQRYTYRLFEASHSKLHPYPVEVAFEPMKGYVYEDKSRQYKQEIFNSQFPIANSQDEFTRLLQLIFRNGQTKALIHSLIAMANETQGVEEKPEGASDVVEST